MVFEKENLRGHFIFIFYKKPGMKKTALFPGSFDPITRGHQSVILRALPLFDEIIIGIGTNSGKTPMFSLEQRIKYAKKVFAGIKEIRVEPYSGFTLDFCRKTGAGFLLRGLRTSGDFEFERVIAHMNRDMNPEIETIFLLTVPEYSHVSSSVVREILKNNGDVSRFIPEGLKLD
jgi:pantetheine-phosphate adenylyltransferase